MQQMDRSGLNESVPFGARDKEVLGEILAGRRKRFMDLQKPAWPSPNMRLGGKIDIWIEKQLRFSAVDGDEHAHLHFERLRAGPERDGREVARELLHHVGAPRHPRN